MDLPSLEGVEGPEFLAGKMHSEGIQKAEERKDLDLAALPLLL